MPRPLKRGIIGASTIILSKDINKYAFMCGSNFYESDVILRKKVPLKPNKIFRGLTLTKDSRRRYPHRFFDQVGYQTIQASIGNKHFFRPTKIMNNLLKDCKNSDLQSPFLA